MAKLEELAEKDIDKLVTALQAEEANFAATPQPGRAPAVEQQPEVARAPAQETVIGIQLEQLSDEQIDQLAQQVQAEEERAFKELTAKGAPEAALGPKRRLAFALEPITKHRVNYLVQEFGKGNVLRDDTGNLWLRQKGQIRPLNKAGFSEADVAEFVGMIPEIVGGTAGAIIGGGPVAGTVGAGIGGAAGNIARQAAAAQMGVPQEISPIERTKEIAQAGGLAAAGEVGGRLLGYGVKQLIPKAEGAKRLIQIATDEGLPKPTFGQRMGGMLQRQEQALKEIPIFGSAIRRTMNKQFKAARASIDRYFGDLDLESAKRIVGGQLKDITQSAISKMKNRSSQLFKEIAEKGKNVFIDAKQIKGQFVNAIKDLQMFDELGNALPYDAGTGLDRQTWSRVQGVLEDIIGSMERGARRRPMAIAGKEVAAPDQTINITGLDALRRTIDKSMKSKRQDWEFADVLLDRVSDRLKDVTGRALETLEPNLSKKFIDARSLWAKQKQMAEMATQLKLVGKRTAADEEVLEKIFRNTDTLASFKQLVDEKTAADAAQQYVFDLLKKKVTRGTLSGKTALKEVEKKADVLKDAIGDRKYKILKNNLEYMASLGEPINPSGTAITQMTTELIRTGLKGVSLQAIRQIARGAKIPEKVVRPGIQAIFQTGKEKLPEKEQE